MYRGYSQIKTLKIQISFVMFLGNIRITITNKIGNWHFIEN